eukprot:scaffold25475_cov20-Tisochrysis_lutea.AAC.1
MLTKLPRTCKHSSHSATPFRKHWKALGNQALTTLCSPNCHAPAASSCPPFLPLPSNVLPPGSASSEAPSKAVATVPAAAAIPDADAAAVQLGVSALLAGTMSLLGEGETTVRGACRPLRTPRKKGEIREGDAAMLS